MEKEKLITEIDLALESVRVHINRIKNDNSKVHKMDMDLLIEKTRGIYDKLIRLDGLSVSFEKEILAEVESEVVVEAESEVVVEAESKAEVVVEAEAEAKAEEVKEHIEEEQNKAEFKDDLIEEKEEIVEEEVIVEAEAKAKVEEEESGKSTIDLFSSSAGPTLSDTFSVGEQPTIADKINKEGINELREAIGINEKFLFINELFNGDLGRYNKIIDELDELATLEGVNTYLLELKIQSQWANDNMALIKLTGLLKRKFVK